MKYIVTGGCGFLGSSISSKLVEKGNDVIVIDNLSRAGSKENYDWLKSKGSLNLLNDDITNWNNISRIIKDHQPDVIFHLAGQVAMTTSIQNPRLDFEINALGTLNILEAVRQYSEKTGIIYSSTNKVYGDLEEYTYEEKNTRYVCKEHPSGFNEGITLNFHSPYGCSKGAADQYILDYSRIFGLKTMVFRHSSMYGSRQYGTFDQGWISWFCQQAVKTTKDPNTNFTISGNGKQVRDVLHADDMIDLYLTASKKIQENSGHAFNIGGGIDNSLSLLELFDMCERELNVKLNYVSIPPRASDQKFFVADINKAKSKLLWKPRVDKTIGIKKMLNWLQNTPSTPTL